MKFLIISGSNETVIVKNEEEARSARESNTFEQIIDLTQNATQQGKIYQFPIAPVSSPANLNAQVEELETKLVLEAMTATKNNQVQAARRLGITRGALQYKLKKIASKNLLAAA